MTTRIAHIKLAQKGSKRDIQMLSLVESFSDIRILPKELHIRKWISPIYNDPKKTFAEHSGHQFLRLIGLNDSEIKQFGKWWPSRGPHWDGIAQTDSGETVLIEAKAHISEFLHQSCKASSPARKIIETTLAKVARYGYATSLTNAWTDTFYQIANRLAFLWLLNSEKFNRRVQLLYLFFTHDRDMLSNSEESEQMWLNTFSKEMHSLGISESTWRTANISTAFVDVRRVEEAYQSIATTAISR